MRHYFIIDKLHILHVIIAANREAAIEKFNDLKNDKADYCIEAERDNDGNYIAPRLPAWMDYKPVVGLRLAGNTTLQMVPDEYGNPEPQQVPIGKDHTSYFEHRKNAIA